MKQAHGGMRGLGLAKAEGAREMAAYTGCVGVYPACVRVDGSYRPDEGETALTQPIRGVFRQLSAV